MSSPKDGKAGLAVIDVPNRKVLRYMTFSEMVRPLTINHDGSLVYVNVNDLIGFEIGDVKTGKMLKRFEAARRLEGQRLQPRHRDDAGRKRNLGRRSGQRRCGRSGTIRAMAATRSTTRRRSIKPTAGVEHSWIDMTNDGKLAFLGDSSVVDVKTHKEIAVMKDEFGRRIVHTEKVLYHELSRTAS